MIIDTSIPMTFKGGDQYNLERVLAKQKNAKRPCPRCSIARALPILRKNCQKPCAILVYYPWPIHNTWATEMKIDHRIGPSPDFPYET